MDNMTPIKEPKGPILGIIVIIVLLVVGGIYIFLNQRGASGLNDLATTTAETFDLGPESASTDLTTIKTELEATDLDSLDAELKNIDAELKTQ